MKITIDIKEDDIHVLLSALTQQIHKNGEDKLNCNFRNDLSDEQKAGYTKWYDGNSKLYEELAETISNAFNEAKLHENIVIREDVIQWIDVNDQLPLPKIDCQTKKPSKYWSIDVDVWIVEENGDEYRKSGIMYNYKQDCWNGTSPIMYEDERDEKLKITHWIPSNDFDKAIIPKGRR